MKTRCPLCGTMNNPMRASCARCSAKLPLTEENAAAQQNSATPAASSHKHERTETYPEQRAPYRTIQVHSTSCQMELAEYKATLKKASLRLSLSIDIPVFLIVFWPILQAIFEGTSLKYAYIYKLDTIWYFIAFGLGVLSYFMFMKYQHPADELIKKYQQYCNLENLTVDQSGIFGSTTKQAINLPYEQISSVRISSAEEGGFRNDQLIIRDMYDQSHTFYSFANARILHDAITNNMRNSH